MKVRFLSTNIIMVLFVWLLWFDYSSPATFAILQDNWPVSLTMVFGSFIAGATSTGGGAIAFPVFTKVFHIAPADARTFSLAIQSVGMNAAVFTIVVMRIKVDWQVIAWASLGGVFGMICSLFLSPLLPPDVSKILFTALVVSLAATLILINRSRREYRPLTVFSGGQKKLILIAGFCGGVMSGLVGNGIDIICFSVMVLLFRMSERLATPTAVVLMAFNSLVGFLLHCFYLGDFSPLIEDYWLAAIPVVVVGAPLGAVVCSRMSNRTITTVLIGLILIEFLSTLWLLPFNTQNVVVGLVTFTAATLIFVGMTKASPGRIRNGQSL